MAQAPARNEKDAMTQTLDRRDVLRLGGAAAAVALVPSWPSMASVAAPARVFVLADPRYRDSVSYARGAESEGATFLPLARNLAEIWFDEVKPPLPRPLIITGLTLDSDLFILSRLAEGSGVRTAYSGTHDWRPGNGSTHRLNGSAPLNGLARALTIGGEDWAGRLGSGIVRTKWNENSGKERSETLTLRIAEGAGRHGPRYLVSWLLSWPGRPFETS